MPSKHLFLVKELPFGGIGASGCKYIFFLCYACMPDLVEQPVTIFRVMVLTLSLISGVRLICLASKFKTRPQLDII